MKHLLLIFSLSIMGHQAYTQHTIQRKGFLFGAAVGVSQTSLYPENAGQQHQIGGSFPNFKVGYLFGPKSALVLNLPGSIYRTWEDRERDRGFEGIVPTFQYWPSGRWWVAAGAGLGLDAPAFYDIKAASERKFYFGGTGLVSTGYELWQKGRFAVDVQLRAHYSNIQVPAGHQNGTAFSVLLGVNWY